MPDHRTRASLFIPLFVAVALLATFAVPTPVPAQVQPTTIPPDDLALVQLVEAESLLPASESTSRISRAGICCGIVRSGGAAITFGGGGGRPGDYVTFDIEIPADGTWQLSADHTVDPSFGISRLSIGDQVLGEFDHYNDRVFVERRVAYPPVELTAGTHTLRFEIIGQNPASSGWRIGTDLYRLRRLPDTGSLAVTPHDGDFVRGQLPVLGYSTDTTDDVGLTVDGLAPADGRDVIGAETATLVFEADGIQSDSHGFANRIEVSGASIPLTENVEGDDRFAMYTDWVDIPGELLSPGPATVTVVAGENDNDCGRSGDLNHDDFQISDVRLQLPDGTVLRDPAMAGEFRMGDGLCGSAPDKPTALDFTFDIPATGDGTTYLPGRGATVDTTAMTDGPHEVTVETADGQRLTSAITVDNTPPTITSTSPPDGEQQKGEFTIDAAAEDTGSGLGSLTATFDGEPVALPTTLSTDDLTDGPHTVVVTAVDRAGGAAERTIEFTTIAQQPDAPVVVAPTDGATGVSTSPELQVRATDPAGDDLTVTFLEGRSAPPLPGRSTTGVTTTSPPADRALPGEDLDGPAVRAATTSDDDRVTSPTTGDFPFQRFDIDVRDLDGADTVEVMWEGSTDPAREIAVFAWDIADARWVELDRDRGSADGDIVLRAPADLTRYRDGRYVHVLVQGEDPFADDIMDPPDQQFRDPATYDFSLAWITDTQYLSEGAVEDRSDAEQFAAAYRDAVDWIVDNTSERKIAYTAHTGDLINNWIATGSRGDTPEYEALARREFEFASETMAVLEEAGMPYGVTPGNHDNKFGTTNELYNEYFPPSRFEAASAAADQPYWGGAWREADSHNHYDLFTAGGQDFIVVYLGFIAGQDEIDWANEVLSAHRDRKAIFATHEYLRPSRNPDGRDGPLSDENQRSQGEELFQEVVLPNPNVFLTLSGHTHGVALNIKRDVGEQGRTVVEMLANYQFYRVDGERRTGFMRLLQFDVDRSEVSVNTYSPTLGDHNAEEFDTSNNRDYTDAADEFTIPVDLASRATSFSTDRVAVEALTDTPVGSARIASGEIAAVPWADLRPQASHSWYAVVTDDFGGRNRTPVASFTTGDRRRGR